METIKKIQAPVRIDFAGGTTDISPFKDTYGGVVLNAAINRYIKGELFSSEKKVGLKYLGNIPTSSGLGTSGVMNLVWLTLISKKNFSKPKEKIMLAEKVYDLEQAMGLVGGKQDQYAAALGGINFLEFREDKVKVKRLNLRSNFIKKLEDNLTLVYTRKPHFSGISNKNMMKKSNIPHLLEIKNIAIEMKKSLQSGNIIKFSELMNEETKERRKLHKSIIPENVEKIIKEAKRNGAISAKICGSGNGGCVLFFGDKERLKKYFKKTVIDFKFDFQGLRTQDKS